MLSTIESFPYQQEYIDYLEVECNMSAATVEAYLLDLRLFVRFLERYFPSEIKVEKVEALQIREFLLYLARERGCQTRARNRKLASVKSYFAFLKVSSYLGSGKNPAAKVRFAKEPQTLPIYLTKEEAETLIKASRYDTTLPYRDYALVRLFLSTGIRLSELVALEVSDIDFSEACIKVRRGKGRKERIAPLSDKACAALKEYLEKRMPAKASERRLFLNHRGAPITGRGVEMIVERICKRAGVMKPHLSVHKLRHTCMTLLLREGVDLITIKELAGHSSIDSTEIYVHVDLRGIEEAMRKHPLG